MTVLVTSWSSHGEEVYGKRFLSDVPRWNLDDFVVYEEIDSGRPNFENLLNLNTWKDFERRWGGMNAIRGKDKAHGHWKTSELQKGYCYRYDAWKFLRKFFALHDATIRFPNETLVWADGDIRVLPGRQVPPGFFDVKPHQVVYLGRDHVHTEGGLVVYGSSVARDLITWMMNRSLSGQFLQNENGWTDCHVFDDARAIFHHIDWVCASVPPKKGAVLEPSRFGAYLTHLKGDRKYATSG